MSILVNPGTTTPVATLDIGGGVQSPQINLINGTGNSIYGSAGSPQGGSTVLAVQGVSGGVAQPVSGTVSLGAGTAAVGTATALQGGTWTVGLSAGTLAIGTTTALQGGTWTVQPGNTPNTSPWLVAPATGVPFPINVTQIGTTAVGSTVGLPTLLRDGAGNARFAAVNASNQLSVSVDGGSLSASISSTATLGVNITQIGTTTVASTGLFTILRDAAGNSRGANVNSSNQLSVSVDAIGTGTVALGQAVMASSVPMVVASDQTAIPVTINSGTAIVQYALPSNSVSTAIGAITGTSVTTLLGTPGSGQRNYLTQLLVTNAHATVSTVVVIGDGSAAAIMTQGYAVAAGGGFSVTFPQPLRQPTTNTSLTCYCVTTGSSIYISASGFKGV